MTEVGDSEQTVEQRAGDTFRSLEDFRDSFIAMGLSEFGARAVQVVCLQPNRFTGHQKRLRLARDALGIRCVETVITDPNGDEEHTYPTMSRAMMSTGSLRYDLVGTGSNLADVGKALTTTSNRRNQLPRFSELRKPLEPATTVPYRRQVTGVISYNKANTPVFGFAALRSSQTVPSADREMLTAVPIERTFGEVMRPGIGLLVSDEILYSNQPLARPKTLLRPTELRGDINEIAAAYQERLRPGGLVAVKMFDEGPHADYVVLPPKPLESKS